MAAERAPWRILMLLAVFAVLSVFLFISLPSKFDQYFHVETTNSFRAPKINVFSELTSQEADDIYDFVFDELAYLNLVGLSQSTIRRRPETTRALSTHSISLVTDSFSRFI